MHDTVSAQVAGTPIHCNPFGYVGYEQNPDYSPCAKFIVDEAGGVRTSFADPVPPPRRRSRRLETNF